MKRLRLISVISVTIIVLVILAGFLGCSKKQEEIKIGAILSLTGDAALYGQNAKEGIDLAVEEVNKEGGILGKNIKVIYEDTQADPKIGLSAFQKLVKVDKVESVIGPITSSVLLAVAPVANKEQVVVLSPAATSPDITEAGDFIFRNWPSDAYEGKLIAEYAYHNLNLRNTSLLLINNDYGKGLKQVFVREFENLGGKIGIIETFNPKDTDFRAQILKLKDSQTEGLYIVGYPEEFVIILKQIKELGLKTQLLSTSAFQDKDIIIKSGVASEGVIYPYPIEPDPTNPVVANFEKNFENKYGKKPGIVCDTGYDALKMIVYTIQLEKGYSGSEIQRGLLSIKDFQGASGIMSFDRNGDIEKIMEIKTVKNGEFVKF